MKKYIMSALILVLALLCGCGADTADTVQNAGTCTVSIRCDTILDHMDELTVGKESLVPENGELLAPTQVTMQEGDTVYSLLQRFFQQEKLHYEFSGSDASAYMAGLCNLYEFDCGSLSGWEYAVNGDFPSVGMGGYAVQDGDEIQLLYTCDLGADLGDTVD